MPFGGNCEFPDFDACVRKMQGKVSDAKGWCATVMRKTEEKCKNRKMWDERIERLWQTYKEVLIPVEAVRQLCGSCADGMVANNLTAIKASPGGISDAAIEGLCKKVGGDPGFHTACMKLNVDVEDKAAFCAWLHKRCTGEYPGEHEIEPEDFRFVDIEAHLREQDLAALDFYKRGLADAPTLYKPNGYVRGMSDGQPMVFVASEESEDRLGDVISVDAWNTQEYQKNPVFLFAHDRTVPPIGKCPKVWVDANQKQLLNAVQWDEDDEFAKQVKGKYQRGFMKAVSVGFRALEFEDRKDAKAGVNFKKVELLEISAVAVPAHPRALAVSKALERGDFRIVKGISKANKGRLEEAVRLIGEVILGPAPAEAVETETISVNEEQLRQILRETFKLKE